MKPKLLSKLNSHTVAAQVQLVNRLKLYDFTKSAINHFCEHNKNEFIEHDFSEFKKKFKQISFKKNREIKSISYKEIIQVGNDFIENELADSIFVLNMSTFEHWVLTILKIRFLDNPGELFNKDKAIGINILREVSSLDELWERIIDEYLLQMPYVGVKKMLESFLKKFNFDKSRITESIVEKIYESSLCRNLIVHNQKKVSVQYVKSCGKFAKFSLGESVKISEDILFEQGDNLLRFMQDFRTRIKD